LLIDVRRFAGSKKYPQFNRDSLAASLESAGIEYEHWPVLGGRRRPKADSPNQVWENDSFRGYADYMETLDFQTAMEKLIARARRCRTAIMCSEGVWWRCHRSMISDYLMNQGIPIFHILDKSAPTLHPFTKPYLAAHGSGPTDREFLYHP
jgi:uncharacterized protein (DUF488 family)